MPPFVNGIGRLDLHRPRGISAETLNFAVAPESVSNTVDEVVVGVHLQISRDMGKFVLKSNQVPILRNFLVLKFHLKSNLVPQMTNFSPTLPLSNLLKSIHIICTYHGRRDVVE